MVQGPPRSNNPDVVSLREFIESRIREVENALSASRESLNARLNSMNEFRRQIESERTYFVPRGEYQIAKESQDKAIHDLQLARANQDGKASQSSVYGAYVVAVFGWLIAIGFGIAGLLK